MGFLSTAEVDERSVTDLVASFTGQTGPKTIQVLERALGKVLFIDEAYRLGEGLFATEAINELVDSLTKPRFAGKLVTVLAGYESNMNELLSVNQGLSSRFSEEVIFTNMKPEHCWNFFQQNLGKTGIVIDKNDSHASAKILSLFRELSKIPSWGNGRDVETISKSIIGSTFQSTTSSTRELTVSHSQIIDFLTTFYNARTARSIVSDPKPLRTKPSDQATQELVEFPKAVGTSQPVTQASEEPTIPTATLLEHTQASQEMDDRDLGVTNAVWSQLQADKAAEELAQRRAEDAMNAEEETARLLAKEVAALAEDVEILAVRKAKDEHSQELKRRHEEARLQHLASRREKEEAEERLEKFREEAERKRKEEVQVQSKLREMGVCPVGYRWIKQAEGYRCAAGGHFVGNGELGV